MDLEGTIYELREDLEVYNTKRDKALAKPLDQDGYVRYGLYVHGKKKSTHLHKIVAHKYLGPRPEGKVINHKDGNKLNNHPSNLEYITALENTAHAKETGLIPKGLDSPQSMQLETLLTIYTMYLSGKKLRQDAPKTLGVSRQGVVRVCQGICHKELHTLLIGEEMADRLNNRRGLIRDEIPAGAAETLYRKMNLEGKTKNKVTKETQMGPKTVNRLLKLYDNSEVYPYSTLFT